MNASSVLRKIKDLDKLEERVKKTVNPSKAMLKQIEEARNDLLAGKGEQMETTK